MMPVIASSAAPADFLSVSISSARAATSCVLVIGFDMMISSFCPCFYGPHPTHLTAYWGSAQQYSTDLAVFWRILWAISGQSPPLDLKEGGFLEAPELPGVDALKRHIADLLHRPDPDQEMPRHLRAVEIARHAGQFQLPVQGFVRDAEQRAVGDPETESVGGDRRTFHVERDGARLAEPLHRPRLVPQFPVAVVDGRHRARPHDALELVALELRLLGH